MAPVLITATEFRQSRYADVAEQVDNIDTIIEQAEAHIQNTLDRTFSTATNTEIHYPSGDKIFTKERPIVTLTSIKRRASDDDAWTDLVVADFEINHKGAAGVIHAWEGNIADYQVQVIYTSGYDITDVPADLKAAVILQTALMAFQDFELYGAGDSKEPALRHMRQEVERLTKPYKKVMIR